MDSDVQIQHEYTYMLMFMTMSSFLPFAVTCQCAVHAWTISSFVWMSRQEVMDIIQ